MSADGADAFALVTQLARAHGIEARRVEELPATGAVNRVFLLNDDLVLRLPHGTDHAVAQTRCELVAAPLAMAAGVRTPALVVADDSCRFVPVPFTIFARAAGIPASRAEGDLATDSAFWHDVGAQLALLHAAVGADPGAEPRGWLGRPEREDPTEMPAALVRDHYLSVAHAVWLDRWIARLEPSLVADRPARFLHADLHPANLMIDPATRRLTAILDWGDAGWGDPALEFRGVPLRAVAVALGAYRASTPGLEAEAVEGCILRDHLALVLERLRNVPQVGGPRWRSEPATPLLELLRFVHEAPARFRPWLPAD